MRSKVWKFIGGLGSLLAAMILLGCYFLYMPSTLVHLVLSYVFSAVFTAAGVVFFALLLAQLIKEGRNAKR